MVWNRDRDRRPQAGRGVAGRRETASRDDRPGRFTRSHPRRRMPLVEELASGSLSSILLLDSSANHLRHGAAPNLPKAYTQAIDGAAIGPSAGSCGTAAYRAETVIVSDVATDPLWND